MIRFASIFAFATLVGCVSAPSDLLVGLPLERRPCIAVAEDDSTPRAACEPASFAIAPAAVHEEAPTLAAGHIEPTLPFSPAAEGLHKSRFTVKGGYFSPEDADEADPGYIANLSWMQFLTRFFALELEVGYFAVDGEDGGAEIDVWGIPAMVNGRLNVPIWVLDLYGGVGVGEIYYDAEASLGGLSADDDGWLFGGNAFLGATINLADAMALGLEGKYYLTEDIDDFDEGLDAYAIMLTLGFSR